MRLSSLAGPRQTSCTIFLCSQPAKGHLRSCHAGRIDLSAIREICTNFIDKATYVCGPGGFMEAARALLCSVGLPSAQFHLESFGGPNQRQTVSRTAEAAPVNVLFPFFGRMASGTGCEKALEIAERDGIEIPHAFRSGRCGTCRVILIAGQVYQECSNGLTEEELATGSIKGCQAKSLSHIEVRLGE